MLKFLNQKSWFIKLTHWEYWPFALVYAPLTPYLLLLMIRARSVFFFNTANPTIRNGGFLMESKKEIFDLMPQQYYPVTLFFEAGTRVETVMANMEATALRYPVIAKPDIGLRGMMVHKINNHTELAAYVSDCRVDFLVQEYISWPQEAGIFYCRYPGTNKGFVSGIVGKELLTIKGDGVSTVEALLQLDQRYILQLPVLRKTHAELLKQLPALHEEVVVVPYGNHCRGAKFLDWSNRIDATLETVIDEVCKKIPGFYFGRMDIRFNSWEELRAGKGFSIVELNGAGSEPTHIYDPGHSIFFAWKEIIRHWNMLCKISRLNHQQQQIPYMKLADGISMLRGHSSYVKQINVHLKQQC